MDPGSERDSEQTAVGPNSGRNYGGVRITPPPSQHGARSRTLADLSAELDRQFSTRSHGRSQQARILTGSALFGVIVIVLLHEFGHWLSGFAVTGMAPDFLLVAVRQKTAEFSTFGGIFTWGAGPMLQAVMIWISVIFVTSRSRSHPRLFAVAGGALAFTLIVHLVNWGGATFTSQDSWGDDLPRVATYFGSWARFWMHLLSAGFMAVILLPAYVWLTVARSNGTKGLYTTPVALGAIQGLVLVLIATFFVSLFN